ncbi:MAG TPA: MaoC family dehydratase [Burkholderiaceae bacterium]|nr:MaoC family dehydratase [Burkholderiaceae bacterium]
MPVPLRERYFEDYSVGEVLEFGDEPVTEADIIEFARRYDPQPFHIDPEAAARSPFGGLIASGWMTAGMMMRLLVDHFISPLSSLGSPGIDELRWTRPVRPGDRIKVRVTVLQVRRSASKPGRGLMQLQQEVVNQRGEIVMTVRGWGLYKARGMPAGEQAAASPGW